MERLERASLLPLILLPQVLSVPAASAGQHGGPAAHRWAYMPAAAPAACQKILCSALNPAPTHGDVHYLVGPNTAAQADRRPGPVPTARAQSQYRQPWPPGPRSSAARPQCQQLFGLGGIGHSAGRCPGPARDSLTNERLPNRLSSTPPLC